jgi:hypothetical protein
MSPVSYGPHSQLSAEETGIEDVDGFFANVLEEFAELGAEPDLLQVELLASEIIGQWWEADDDLGPELIDFAAGQATPAAAALLAALRVFALTEEQREAAAEALGRVTEAGVAEPSWAASLGEVPAGDCWVSGDVYGDGASLLCFFGEGTDAHGVLMLVDNTDFDGWAKDVVVVESPDDVLTEMRAEVADAGELATLDQVPAGQARRLIEDALFGTDQFAEPEVSEEFVRFRALAIARARRLPEPDEADEPGELSEQERDDLVAEFLAEAEGIEDTPATRANARLLVDFGCEREPSSPLRVGPEKLAGFLDSLLESDVEIDEEQETTLAPVLLAWASWAGYRDGLPESAVTALTESVSELLEEFIQDESVVDVYLDGTEEFEGPEELAELLERRMFAVPSVYTQIGDEELDLDPGDPEQRGLLVLGEHPEYHDLLAEDALDDEARTHIALKTAVVDQLWDGDPVEVWHAVRRLQEKGLERTEIFDELGRVLGEQLQPSEGDELEFDLAGYRRSLADVG